MNDKLQLNELMESLKMTPDKETKQKAKALFLQKAEETSPVTPVKKAGVFSLKNKRFLFRFAAGAAAALIIAIGILTAYDPSFLTGSVSGVGDVIQYRMFPAEEETPVLVTAQKYAGELSILHIPGANEIINSQFIKSGGAAFTGGFAYYITQSGSKADIGSDENSIIKDRVRYIPVNLSDYKTSYGNEVCYGELVLLKASARALQKYGYILCSGQTLNASDYPVLAEILAPGAEKFSLPDLSGKSPVEGAVWCIAAEGDYPYIQSAGD